MSYDDFCRLTVDEFSAVYRAWGEDREDAYHSDWERMRLLATIVIQPHVKKRLTAEKLLPFPWDKGRKGGGCGVLGGGGKVLGKEESRARFAAMVGRGG